MKATGYGIAVAGLAIASAMSNGADSLVLMFWAAICLAGLFHTSGSAK